MSARNGVLWNGRQVGTTEEAANVLRFMVALAPNFPSYRARLEHLRSETAPVPQLLQLDLLERAA